jgi:hypothetical protein
MQVHLKALEIFLGFVLIHSTCLTQLPPKYFAQRGEGDKKRRQKEIKH